MVQDVISFIAQITARYFVFVTMLACIVIAPTYSHAAPRLQGYEPTGDHMWDTSQLCQALFPRMEREYAIPIYLLSAIAVTESGRHHKASGMRIPWPWTVQSQGKGYYFRTMEEAVAKVTQLQKRGIRNIDVGCMQVNLRYHGMHFATLSQAFDPRQNVSYAASYLTQKYRKYNSWKSALAGYHAGLASRGGHYAARVMRAWNEVMTRSVSHSNVQPTKRLRRMVRAPIPAAYDPEEWKVRTGLSSDVVVLHAPAVHAGEHPTRNDRALLAAEIAQPKAKPAFISPAVAAAPKSERGPLVIGGNAGLHPVYAVGHAESRGEVTERIAFADPTKVYTAPGAPKNLRLHTIQVAQSGATAQMKAPKPSSDIWGKVRMIFQD